MRSPSLEKLRIGVLPLIHAERLSGTNRRVKKAGVFRTGELENARGCVAKPGSTIERREPRLVVDM